MRGRPTLHSNDQLIEKAQEIFWRKGYTATSLNDLLKVPVQEVEVFTIPLKVVKRKYFVRPFYSEKKLLISS